MPTTDSNIHLTTTESPMRNGVDTRHLFAATPPLAEFQFRATNRGSAALTTLQDSRLLRHRPGAHPLAGVTSSLSWCPPRAGDPRSDRADSLDRRPRPMAHSVSSTMTTPEPSMPPQTWTSERAEGFVCLGQTEHAPSSEFRDLWMGTIDPTD